ncbi:MAG: AAA family ATPase [Dehalococcoidia bacterium]|nr:AAA family ATPase [Dehalococcoidia bacterium]
MVEVIITEVKLESKRKFDWHDHAVRHDALLGKKLNPIEFLVRDMLVNVGTGVIAGPKKKRKSFMATQLTHSVASGKPFLGHAVKQGSVVHFALEDGERRTQARIQRQSTMPGLPITWFYQWPAFNTSLGFEQLRLMLAELKPALVVVDTFAKCLNGKPDQNSAGDMADFGNRIHDLALEMNTMILFIAHHGKMSTRDPGFDIRGSSAIPSSTDVNIGLYRNSDDTFDLIGEGRDIEDFDLRVKFDTEAKWVWEYVGEAKDARREEAEKAIIRAIEFLGGNVEASAIADEIGITRPSVQPQLKRMREEGTIACVIEGTKPKKILYSLTSSSTSSSSSSYNHLLHRQNTDAVDEVSDVYKKPHNTFDF